MKNLNPPFQTQLPELYKKILPNSILDMNLNETKATCDNCIMAKTSNTKSTRTTNNTKNINKDLSITNQKKITYQGHYRDCAGSSSLCCEVAFKGRAAIVVSQVEKVHFIHFTIANAILVLRRVRRRAKLFGVLVEHRLVVVNVMLVIGNGDV